jgi:hypothetical protein
MRRGERRLQLTHRVDHEMVGTSDRRSTGAHLWPNRRSRPWAMNERHRNNEARGVEPAVRRRLLSRIPNTQFSSPAINRRTAPHMSEATIRAFPVASPVQSTRRRSRAHLLQQPFDRHRNGYLVL